MTEINKETTIAEVIAQKGVDAGKVMDTFFCNETGTCCPGTTHQLGFAATLKGKSSDQLEGLLSELNSMPDYKPQAVEAEAEMA